MKKILFLLFTIVGVSFPAHAKSNIQKSQDYTPEKGFTFKKTFPTLCFWPCRQ